MSQIGFILQAEKGMPGGVPVLNSLGIVEDIHLPDTILTHNSAEVEETIIAGQPIYVKQNGKLRLASAANNIESQVIGIALESREQGYSITYSAFGTVTLLDWTIAIGSVNLVSGCNYFLDNMRGRITNIAPITSASYLVYVGRAISSNILVLNIQPKIQL